MNFRLNFSGHEYELVNSLDAIYGRLPKMDALLVDITPLQIEANNSTYTGEDVLNICNYANELQIPYKTFSLIYYGKRRGLKIDLIDPFSPEDVDMTLNCLKMAL